MNDQKTDSHNEASGPQEITIRPYELLIDSVGYLLVSRFMDRLNSENYAIGATVVISWNWLMPVVEKIEAMDIVTTRLFKTHFQIVVYKSWQSTVIDKDITHHYNPSPKIEAVYKAVVEFIHWYQKQKSS